MIQVDLVVRDRSVSTKNGKELELNKPYLLPGFWYEILREGERLVATLAKHGCYGHEVCRLDISENGEYSLSPYSHQQTLRPLEPIDHAADLTEEKLEESPANGAVGDQTQLDGDHARIDELIKLLSDIQGSTITAEIDFIGSMMHNLRRAWPRRHSRHVTDGTWQRIGRKPAADAKMTSSDATYIIFVAEQHGTIVGLTIWVSITCNIDELITALEDL